MKILVYGAGNIGSLYAAKLKHAGHDVTILARGQRLREIRENGIRLQDSVSGKATTTRVEAVEILAPDDAYDLVLVILPRQRVCEVLPTLAENRNTPNVLFFANNAAGPAELIESLGRERVLLGFPGAAGIHQGDHIRYLILDRREQPTTIGEVDGAESRRIKAIAAALKQASLPVSICRNMDAWLKTHVAEIVPTAGALYKAKHDIDQLKHNRKALGLMIRAIREGFRVLSALDIPITPSIHKVFRWIPEFLLVALMRRKLNDESWGIKIGHASNASDEMKFIANELRELARQSEIATPALDELQSYVNAAEQPANAQTDFMSEASRQATSEVETAR